MVAVAAPGADLGALAHPSLSDLVVLARAEPAPIPGRGRGVSNLPAWMTGGVPEPPPAAPPSPPRKRERDQFEDAAEPAAKRVAPASADAELRAALLRLATDDFAAFSALIEEVRSRAAPR